MNLPITDWIIWRVGKGLLLLLILSGWLLSAAIPLPMQFPDTAALAGAGGVISHTSTDSVPTKNKAVTKQKKQNRFSLLG